MGLLARTCDALRGSAATKATASRPYSRPLHPCVSYLPFILAQWYVGTFSPLRVDEHPLCESFAYVVPWGPPYTAMAEGRSKRGAEHLHRFLQDSNGRPTPKGKDKETVKEV
jgi:hypothetical protein